MTYADGTPIANIKSDLIRTRINGDQMSPLLKKPLFQQKMNILKNIMGWYQKR